MSSETMDHFEQTVAERQTDAQQPTTGTTSEAHSETAKPEYLIPSLAVPATPQCGTLGSEEEHPAAAPSAGSQPATPPVRLTRAEAARQNGAKSRGPRSEEGKQWSRRNAIKHGLLAKILLATLAEEDRLTFEAILEGLSQDYRPTTFEQQQLVHMAGLELWRLAQAAQHEIRNLAYKELFVTAVPDRHARYSTAAWRRYRQIVERLEKLIAR